MKNIFCAIAFCFQFAAAIFSQTDTASNMVKYTRDFKFKDGIFMTFNEFKNNEPSVTKFEMIKNKASADENDITLSYNITDSTGKTRSVSGDNCFGFCNKGVLYFNNGNNGFYRMFIVGALSHYIATQHTSLDNYDYYREPSMIAVSANDVRQYVLDFNTGEAMVFNYKNFKDFLKSHDTDLFQQLEKSKNKRDMIHFYLLKYNEKHPIYFPK